MSLTKQVGGSHYVDMPIQPWEIIDAHNLGFYEGCALKYLLRHKPGVDRKEDLQKLIHCIEHEIERLSTNGESHASNETETT